MRVLLALGFAGWALLAQPVTLSVTVRDAEASVAVAYTLNKLVAESASVVVARAVEQRSEWTEIAGGRRIVTYTRLVVTEQVRGEAASDVWVRTLGGVVGRIGQQVSGEATFELEGQALVFLTRATDGAWVVAGMAQGHYPVRRILEPNGHAVERLVASQGIGALVARKANEPLAHARLVGRTLSEATDAVRTTAR